MRKTNDVAEKPTKRESLEAANLTRLLELQEDDAQDWNLKIHYRQKGHDRLWCLRSEMCKTNGILWIDAMGKRMDWVEEARKRPSKKKETGWV